MDTRSFAMGVNRGVEIGGQALTGAALEQYNVVNAKLNMLSDVIRRRPLFNIAYGNGVINIRDAAAGRIDCIQVDSELAGQTLYIQVENASGITDAQAEADDKGYATVDLSTVRGENRFYITAQAYAFPPTGDGSHGELDGVYVNPRTNENGLAVYDSIQLANGVHAVVRYRTDWELYSELANETLEEQILAASGRGVRYDALQNPLSPDYMNDFLYMKLDGYPYGTQATPTYAHTGYPNPDCQVYYVRRFYDLTE